MGQAHQAIYFRLNQRLEKEQTATPRKYNSNSQMIIKIGNLIIQFNILRPNHKKHINFLNQKELHGRIPTNLKSLIMISILSLILQYLAVGIQN